MAGRAAADGPGLPCTALEFVGNGVGATVAGGGVFEAVTAGTVLEGKGVVAGVGAAVGTGATAGAGVNGDGGFVTTGVWLNAAAEHTAKSTESGSDLTIGMPPAKTDISRVRVF